MPEPCIFCGAGTQIEIVDDYSIEGDSLKVEGYAPGYGCTSCPLKCMNRFPRPKGRGSLIFAQNSLHPRLESRGFSLRINLFMTDSKELHKTYLEGRDLEWWKKDRDRFRITEI